MQFSPQLGDGGQEGDLVLCNGQLLQSARSLDRTLDRIPAVGVEEPRADKQTEDSRLLIFQLLWVSQELGFHLLHIATGFLQHVAVSQS